MRAKRLPSDVPRDDMIHILISILAFIVAIGVLVAFHEFGHFWVARQLGVKVLRYSIGFGTPLWRRRSRKSGIEYVIAALPLGGYVRMLDEREGEVPEAEKHLAFNRQPVWKRVLIVVAGPGFNFVFAILAYWLVFVIGVTGMKPLIGDVAGSSPAFQAGLRGGEEIVAVDGTTTRTWDAARTELLEAALGSGEIHMRVRESSGSVRRVTLDARGVSVDPQRFFNDLGMQPMQPTIPPVIGEVVSGEPAASAGFEPGDLVVSANGAAIANWSDWVKWVRARPGQTASVVVERDGTRKTLQLTIGHMQQGGESIGHIGAGVRLDRSALDAMSVEVRYGPLAAVPVGVGHTWEMTTLTLSLLGRMVTGGVSWHNVSGPINIAQYAGYSAQLGLASFLSFLAIVSISLGVLNLLPVPVLDGGHLLYYVVEFIKGSPLSEKAQMVGQQIGLALLLMLMSLAFYNDIARLVG